MCYMGTISHRELRNSSSEVLRRVGAGESFTITNHGRPVARLLPVTAGALDEARETGQVRPPRAPRDFSGIVRADGVSSAEVLADLRGER